MMGHLLSPPQDVLLPSELTFIPEKMGDSDFTALGLSLTFTGALKYAETWPQMRFSTLDSSCKVQVQIQSGFAIPLKLEPPVSSASILIVTGGRNGFYFFCTFRLLFAKKTLEKVAVNQNQIDST